MALSLEMQVDPPVSKVESTQMPTMESQKEVEVFACTKQDRENHCVPAANLSGTAEKCLCHTSSTEDTLERKG